LQEEFVPVNTGNKAEIEKPKFRISLFISLSFIVVLWLVKIFEEYTLIDLTMLGVYPRKLSGLIGIITSPLIHANFSHLISNSIPLLVLMIFLFYAYTNSSFKVFLSVYFLPNTLVWIFAREAFHIGASGIVYGLVTFLFFVGVFRRDTKSIGLSLLVIFLYGGLVWGILPTDPTISFEAHLSGAIVGLVAALVWRNADPLPEKYEWEYENDDDEEDVNMEEFEKEERKILNEDN